MAEFIGRRVNLGVAVESVRGDGAAPTLWVPRTELTFQDRSEKVTSSEAHGHIDASTDAFVTEKYGMGNVGGELRDDSLGYFLYAMLGTVNTTNLGSSTYSHAFTQTNSNQHKSLCFTIDDPNADDCMFPLVMLNSFTFTMETGQLSTYSAEFMSKSSVDTAQTATYTASNRWVSHFVNMRLATDTSGLAAASDLPIKSFTMTVSKNVTRDHNFGTIQPTEIHNQQFSIEGSFTLNLEDHTYRDYMMDNTYRALRLSAANTDVALGAGSPTITIDLSRVDFKDWERNNDLDAISLQTINFTAHKDISGAQDMVDACTLINAVASY